MRTISIPAGSLAVMSGIPGSGKSHLLANSALAPGVAQSTDALRTALGGTSVFYDKSGRRVVEPLQTVGTLVWQTLIAAVQERLKQGLTTIVDATLIADEIPDTADRAMFAEIARQHNVPFKVLILDTPLEQAIKNNERRDATLSPAAMDKFIHGLPGQANGGFQPTSRFDHEIVSSSDRIQISAPLTLSDSQWDVIGDVHGLLDELKAFLAELGYQPTDDGLVAHPDGRRLLFMGDIVDRGPKSIEALEFVMGLVHAGRAHCIRGNHEEKLVRFWERMKAGQMDAWNSFANAQTGMQLVQLPEKRAHRLVDFMRSMPLFATYEDAENVVAFAHADARAINVNRTDKGELLSGASDWGRVDSDLAMQRYLEREDIFSPQTDAPVAPTRRQMYVRGHIPPTSQQPNVLSLDDHAFMNGTLRALRLDAMLAGEKAVHAYATGYDYRIEEKDRTASYKELKSLVDEGMATMSVDPATGLRLFKYARKVFYEGLWGEHEALAYARGHVYDIAGNIVSNPFDKVFNYQERDTGADMRDDTPVRAVFKLNGFLGVVSPHPVKANDLLVHTTGSFKSDFVGYIQDYLTPQVRGRMLGALARQPLTLMFEVLHPEDPHVIHYEPEEHGLYLIGAREIRAGSPLLTENELDALAQRIGLRRPGHYTTTFGNLMATNRDCRHEGFMVRGLDVDETMILKLKSPYYLTTKFLSRMKDGNWKHLYANPESFKSRLDEEFFPLVDLVRERCDLQDILGCDEIARRDLVAGLIDEMMAMPAADANRPGARPRGA